MSPFRLASVAILRGFSSRSGVHLSEWERGKKGAIPHATVKMWVNGVEQARREHVKVSPVSVLYLLPLDLCA